MNPDMIFLRRLSNITNAIIERNEDDSSSTFTLTQEIDEKLDILRKEMPQGYWDIPPAPVGKRFAADDVEYLRLTSVRIFRAIFLSAYPPIYFLEEQELTLRSTYGFFN